MCNIDKLYDKIIRNSKKAEKQYLSIVTSKATAEKFKESPMTDEAFKEQLVRVLRNNVLDTDIRITGDMAIGEKECSGLFLRTLSDETILNECKARGLDVKYSEETELAYRLNWVMQDYCKAGKDEEEQEHRVKCYKLFWDALEDSMFFEQKEQNQSCDNLDDEIHRFSEECIDVHEAKLYGNISERVIPVDCYELTARHFAKWGERHEEQKPKRERKKPKESWLEKSKYELAHEEELLIKRQKELSEIRALKNKEQKPAEIAPNQFDGITYGMQGYSTEKPAEWNEDWREEDIQTRFAFYTYKDEDGVLYLSNVFVEEASRNHGFGTRILRAAEKVAETIGVTTIRLKVKQDSPANAWYRKNGYGYVAFEDGYDWLEKNLEYMKPNKQEWSEDTKDEFTQNIRNLITNKLTVHTKGLDGSELSSTVFIDDETAKDIASGVLFYVGKAATKNPNIEIPEWNEEDENCWNLIWDILDGPFSTTKDGYKKAANWFIKNCPKGFKSLRPSWKPSEINPEEVRLLDTTISFLKDFADKGYENAVECIDWLKSKRNGTARK